VRPNLHSGLLFRLDGDAALADHAVRELLNVCEFKDWHPPHFLDTAEMAHAAAIGYDWLYDRLTPEQRRTVVEAIVAKACCPPRRSTTAAAGVEVHHNWNQVCNGGIAIGALAIATRSRNSRPSPSTPLAAPSSSHAQLRAEGGWAEGPGYWHYATRYNVYYLAALQSALGTDLGLLKEMPGFTKAGDFASTSVARWAGRSTTPTRATGQGGPPRCSGWHAPSTSRATPGTSGRATAALTPWTSCGSTRAGRGRRPRLAA